MLKNTAAIPEVMFIKNVLYWDPNVYQYLQGFSTGTVTVEDFIANVDAYRAEMFDIAK